MARTNGIVVEFDSETLRRYAYSGVDRRVSAMAKGRKGAHGFNRDDFWQIDVEGVLCEAAAAHAFGVGYDPVVGQLDTGLGDICPGMQVRGTKYDSGHMLIHDSDNDDDVFVLVTGGSGLYIVRGWIKAKSAKKSEFVKTYGGRTAYWVPQSALKAFTPTVIKSIREKVAANA